MRKILTIAMGVVKELFRRKDIYLILAILFVVIIYAGSASFGGEKGFYRYFKEIGISLTYLFSVIIAVSFAARQVPQEIETKSIYTVLSRPVSRLEFLAGKFLGVWLISAVSFTLFYFVFIISLALKGDASTPAVLLLLGSLLHLLLLSFLASLTVLLSLFLSTAANIGITLLIYFGNNWFGATVPGSAFLPHLEFFDIKEKIVHTQEIIPGWVVLFLILYAACYCALFLILANLVFRKRNL